MTRILDTLDRSKPYGTVHGGVGYHRYEQNGKRFGHDQIEIPDDPSEPVARPKPGQRAEAAPAPDDLVEVEINGVKLKVAAADLPKIAPVLAAQTAASAAPPAVQAAKAAAEGAAAPAPQPGTEVEGQPVEAVTAAQIRARYHEITGKNLRPGLNKQALYDALRKAAGLA